MPKVSNKYRPKNRCTLLRGNCFEWLEKLPKKCMFDLVVTSPPYCMGKEYDTSNNVKTFIEEHEKLFSKIIHRVNNGGSICWQVGVHVKKNEIIPLDYLIYSILSAYPSVKLRNRIIWHYEHGLHGTNRLSGRHETILWFTKGDDYYFDLDAVRVKQKYPGKMHYKGPKKGQYSCNPLGKNPGDVWTIPNVKANHIEKTEHPCQFPVALAQRLIKALCPVDGLVFDPFMGSGTTGVAAAIEQRRFIGSELKTKYFKIGTSRCQDALDGKAKYRQDKPTLKPNQRMKVARTPEHLNFAFTT